MSISKIIKFYQFEPQPSMLNNGLTETKTIDLIKLVFPTCNTYYFNFENEDFAIDIHEIGMDFIFGTCSKRSELKYTNFYQVRDKHTNKAEPYTSIDPDTQLEVYTYFYINCSQNRMAAIQHKSISKIHYILSEFIYSKSGNQLNFFINPERIPDIKKAAKQLKQSNRLQLSYAKGKSKDNIRSLAETLGDFEYESYSIEIKLSQKTNDRLIDKLSELSSEKRDDYTGIRLLGKNEYGLDETINFIETLYSKNTPFDITDDAILNISIIKDILARSLIQ